MYYVYQRLDAAQHLVLNVANYHVNAVWNWIVWLLSGYICGGLNKRPYARQSPNTPLCFPASLRPYLKMNPMDPASFNHRTEQLSTGRTYHFVDQRPVSHRGNESAAAARTILCVHGFPDIW
jgi:hypothetical protein